MPFEAIPIILPAKFGGSAAINFWAIGLFVEKSQGGIPLFK